MDLYSSSVKLASRPLCGTSLGGGTSGSGVDHVGCHRGLLATSLGLLTVVFIRLTFNPAIFTYHARSETPIFNWYLYTYLIAVAATEDKLLSGVGQRVSMS